MNNIKKMPSDEKDLKKMIQELKIKLSETQKLYLNELNKLSDKIPCYKQNIRDKYDHERYDELQEENGDLEEENDSLIGKIDSNKDYINYLEEKNSSLDEENKELKEKVNDFIKMSPLWKDGEDSENTEAEDSGNTEAEDNSFVNTLTAKNDKKKPKTPEVTPTPITFGDELVKFPPRINLAPLKRAPLIF
jgi:chromosome condensin MukBEF ATPase and DNA-binding subunit MukB